jgi:O-antigen/teichoic acid export membrane protein
MLQSARHINHSLIWIAGPYAVSVVLRFGTNIILARLLSPDIFGVMLILTTLRVGVELVTDVGIAQNIVQHKEGGDRAFYNTAWTVQQIRGVLIGGVMVASAVPLARLYEIDPTYILFSAAVMVIGAMHAPSQHLLQRSVNVRFYNLFDLAHDVLSSVVYLTFAKLFPTVYGLLYAGLLTVVLRTVSTFFLPKGRVWYSLDRRYVRDILSFGKWIFLASLVSYLCSNFDRLYLGQVAPLAALGVFGIARGIADLPVSLMARIGNTLLFPLIAASRDGDRATLEKQLASTRLRVSLLAAVVLAFGVCISDIFIRVVYDHRYQDAGWMLPILLTGIWTTLLASPAEYTLLGLGKPKITVVGNAAKFALYLVGLPLAFTTSGMFGAVVMIAVSDIARYIPVAYALRRVGLSTLKQDGVATLAFAGTLAAMCAIRYAFGWGTPFDGISLLVN